jgi:ABC-type cobalamin/Fe3+-siderophores transport system ATPase subunit
MQKIKSITLRNFKFFYGTETEYEHNKIELNENNLLLYGENGSGKSSLYWALYTFLQSCLKSDDDKVQKYFLKDGAQSLKNRYANDTDTSAIAVEFVSADGTTTQKVISDTSVNTKSGTLVQKTSSASDFLNYKYLSKFYDFRNSQSIDLFPLFVKDLLMFIDFEDEFRNHADELSGSSNAADWWDFISKSYKDLPKNHTKDTYQVSSAEYQRFDGVTIPTFIDKLKSYLLKITESANDYLRNDFKEPVAINFNTETTSCSFNNKVSSRTRDQKIHQPKINLTARLIDPKLAEDKQLIHNPHTFLNEARLTAIALAIRFAMLDERGTFSDAGSVLVLDDLLLSLDMSHRNIVLDIILKKEAKHQILILTHDKFFFQMAKSKIKHFKQKNWEYIEMYSHKSNDIPLPLIYNSESYLGKAIRYLKENEYEIAGNFLRKEAESFLKEILSKKFKLNDEGKLKALGNLLTDAIVFSESNSLNKELFEKLNSHREFVLNPSSHDSYDVPKFYSELSSCIDTLTELRKIEINKTIFKKGDELEFTTKDDKGVLYLYEIKLGDDIDYIKEPDKVAVLTKLNINYRFYKDGIEIVEKDKNERDWRHDFTTLKKLYDYCYNNSDKSGAENYLNGIVFSETKESITFAIV